MPAQDNGNRNSEMRTNLGSEFSNVFQAAVNAQSADPNMQQSTSNVGVASRLINKDATPSWNRLLVTNSPVHPQMVPMSGHPSDHHGLSYTVLHQDNRTAENLPTRLPTYSSVNFQIPFLNNQQFIYGNPMNPFIMFGASPSPVVNLPISSGQRFPLGFGNESHQTSLVFQYPLHHLTGRDMTGRDLTGRDSTGRDLTGRDLTGRDSTGRDSTGRDLTAESVAPVRVASCAPHSSEQKGFVTSTLTGTGGYRNLFPSPRSSVVTQPIVQTSLGHSSNNTRQESDASVPKSPSQNPTVTVVPAFVFDHPECDIPEDLSQRSREFSENPAVQLVLPDSHCSTSVVSPTREEASSSRSEFDSSFRSEFASGSGREELASGSRSEFDSSRRLSQDSSEMDLAASEWSKAEAAGSEDCWTFLDSFKQKRVEREHSFVKFRSFLARSPKRFREFGEFQEAKILPKNLLESLNLTVRRIPEVEKSEEISVEAANVDQGALRSLVQQLTGTPLDTPTFSTDTEMKEFLRAVGLVEKEKGVAAKENLFFRRIKRKPHAKTPKSMEVAGFILLDIGEIARTNLKKQLNQSLGNLSVQMKKLKRKMNTVKRIIRDEQQCGDSDVPVLLAELEKVLAE